MSTKIAVIGLGYVGLPLARLFATVADIYTHNPLLGAPEFCIGSYSFHKIQILRPLIERSCRDEQNVGPLFENKQILTEFMRFKVVRKSIRMQQHTHDCFCVRTSKFYSRAVYYLRSQRPRTRLSVTS